MNIVCFMKMEQIFSSSFLVGAERIWKKGIIVLNTEGVFHCQDRRNRECRVEKFSFLNSDLTGEDGKQGKLKTEIQRKRHAKISSVSCTLTYQYGLDIWHCLNFLSEAHAKAAHASQSYHFHHLHHLHHELVLVISVSGNAIRFLVQVL